MDKQQAQQIIRETFENPFDKQKFTKFILDFLNHFEEDTFIHRGYNIPDSYYEYISSWQRLGKYSDGENRIDILIVNLKKETSLERARSRQRNFVAGYLQGKYGRSSEKEAALVAYVSPNKSDWRFSLVKMDISFKPRKDKTPKLVDEFTPARRWSFLVGENEGSHTAQSRLVKILANDEQAPTLKEIENAFDIETVTKEFFLKYRELFLRTKDELDRVVENNSKVAVDFEAKGVDTVNFSKKLLGQIVFLYFLQKKGWFGVGRDNDWGTGSKQFLRELFRKKHGDYNNFFNDILEPLFYEALRRDRSDNDGYYRLFDCKIPFLNGGLFDPIGEDCGYDWVRTEILLPNTLFSNKNKTKEGDTGDGILDIFDRYNFTVKEDEPLEKEVAIDPELLGKAYEKFNAIRPDNFYEFKKALKSGKKGEENKFNKKFGVYYTPREIVHYMCQQSLINYLHTQINMGTVSYQKIGDNQTDMLGNKAKKGQLNLSGEHRPNPTINREDIENLIYIGEQVSENEVAALIKEQNIKKGKQKTSGYKLQLTESTRSNAALIDQKLADITVCDPAVGSGAFPVGMMSEIVRTRNVLSVFLNDNSRTAYEFKRRCIEHSLYGVDIDPGAVEIAKLRLWLSLVVDEEDIKNIKPLPNLDYKVVCGNSLLGVEKDLFNLDLFAELEKLKPLFFNETNPTKKKKYITQIDNLISQITNGHTEFDFKVYFSEVFHKKGFDILIANPPYIGQKMNNKIFMEVKATYFGKKFHQRRMDYLYFFFHKGLDILKDKGVLSYITTNYYLTATYADILRKDFYDRSIVKLIINFNELRIFESALGQHNAITILEKSKDKALIANTAFVNITGHGNNKIFREILSSNNLNTCYSRVANSKLFEGNNLYIRIPNFNSYSLKNDFLHKLLSNSEILDNICYVSTCIQTGADKITDSHKRKHGIDFPIGTGIFVLNETEWKKLELNREEREILKPWFKNSNIHKWKTNHTSSERLIYLTSKGKYKDIKNLVNYLSQYKPVLINRNTRSGTGVLSERDYNDFVKGRKEISYVMIASAFKRGDYYCVSYSRDPEVFTGPKIVAPQRSKENTFGYNEVPWYAGTDIHIIAKPKKNYNLKYILALINSKLYYYWLYHKGKRKGEILELVRRPISEMPIKIISSLEQQPFIALSDSILTITKDDDYQQNSQKQAKVKALEAEINQLVYKLYGLTVEEIRIVDGEK